MLTSPLTPTVLNPLLLGKDYMILHLEEGKCQKQMCQGYT